MSTKLILSQLTDSIVKVDLGSQGSGYLSEWKHRKFPCADHFTCCCFLQIMLELSLLTRWDLRSELQSERQREQIPVAASEAPVLVDSLAANLKWNGCRLQPALKRVTSQQRGLQWVAH